MFEHHFHLVHNFNQNANHRKGDSSWWLITTFLPCNDSVEWWQLSPQLWCWSMLIITVTITIIPFCHCPHKYDVDWWWWSSQLPLIFFFFLEKNNHHYARRRHQWERQGLPPPHGNQLHVHLPARWSSKIKKFNRPLVCSLVFDCQSF